MNRFIIIFALSFVQTASFAMVSRARNRNNAAYHVAASIVSNAVFFLTFRSLVLSEMSLALFVPYTLGTASGSLAGAKVSMWIEKAIGAKSD